MYFFFFFPVGTDTRPRIPPVGTVVLLLILSGAFALRYVAPELYAALVLESFRPSSTGWAKAVLSLFLHGSWMHLLGNGLYLWIFGRQFEGRVGLLPLVAVFFGGGVAACWVHAGLTSPGSASWDMPLVGASGSIAALLGATILRFAHQKVRVLYFLFAFLGGMTRGGVVYVNTVLACLFWFAYQIVYGLIAWTNGGGAIAYAAHGGGFVAGIALGLMLGLPWEARREIHRERGDQHFQRGNWFAAVGELTAHLERDPGDAEARRKRARALLVLARVGEATVDYLTVFRQLRERREYEELARLYSEMRVYGVGSNLAEKDLLGLAFEFQKRGRAAEAAELFLELLHRFPMGPRAEIALIRRAELLWSELGKVDSAREAYRQFLEAYPESEWRDLAEARLGSMSALSGSRPPRSSREPRSPRGSRTPRTSPASDPDSA